VLLCKLRVLGRLLGRCGAGAAAEEAADGVSDRGTDSDTAVFRFLSDLAGERTERDLRSGASHLAEKTRALAGLRSGGLLHWGSSGLSRRVGGSGGVAGGRWCGSLWCRGSRAAGGRGSSTLTRHFG